MTHALSRTLPAALLCDMDGTLVDTEHAWLTAVGTLLRAHGAPADTPAVTPYAGLPVEDAATLLADRVPLPAAEVAARLDREMTARVAAGVTVQPGALRMLDQARRLGVPVALVTAADRPVAELVLKTLGADRFACSVTQGETPRGKPHPDPYLSACAGLGVDPAYCLAVEDTPTGCAAALAAGCHVLAVPSVPGIAPGPRTTVATSLRAVDLHDYPFG